MRVTMDVNVKKFTKDCFAMMDRIGRGTKKATKAAVDEIYEESIRQVPKNSSTLMMSAYKEVKGSSPVFEGIVGYGGNGDPMNPFSHRRASEYMVKVHEDLYARHTIGKAKFLEDPIKQFTMEKFPRTYIKHIMPELNSWGR